MFKKNFFSRGTNDAFLNATALLPLDRKNAAASWNSTVKLSKHQRILQGSSDQKKLNC